MAAAYAARKLGVPATIVVPASTPQLVVQRLKDEGAAVRIAGKVRCDGMACRSATSEKENDIPVFCSGLG